MLPSYVTSKSIEFGENFCQEMASKLFDINKAHR
jgi:hypothetical protein